MGFSYVKLPPFNPSKTTYNWFKIYLINGSPAILKPPFYVGLTTGLTNGLTNSPCNPLDTNLLHQVKKRFRTDQRTEGWTIELNYRELN